MRLFRFRRGEGAPGGTVAPAGAPGGAPGESEAEALEAARAEAAEELAAVMDASTARTRRGGFGRLGGVLRRGGAVTAETWEALEEILISADVGVATTTDVVERTRARARPEKANDAEAVRAILQEELRRILLAPRERGSLFAPGASPPPPPHVILVVGVNGAGKTTSIGKLAHAYTREGRQVLLAAADTFRAAAIEQLQHWGEQAGARVIAHQAGADPGAVAYDAVSAGMARGADVVIIDTAGRLQTKKNLMAELGKVRRVIAGRLAGAPHETLLVIDATTGQNGLSQARLFNEATEITGIILAKLDGTSKGGIVFAIARELGAPVRFVGTGEGVGDIAPFDAETYVAALFREDGGAAGGGGLIERPRAGG